MSWQDIVYSVGNLIFALSLIPSIRSDDKPHLYTSIPTAALLLVFAFTSYTLGLIMTAVVTLIGSALWAVLAVQKIKHP
jgi:hypothetical protein